MPRRGFTVKKNWDNPREHAMPEGVRVPAEVRIGSVAVTPATVLAPMAGVTDTVFRRFIRHASLFSSEQSSIGGIELVSQVPKSEGPGAPAGALALTDTDAAVRNAGAPSSSEIEAAVTNAQSGCGLLMTEFTSADGLARMRESKRRRYLTFYDDEHPIGAQIFGSNPETLAEAARIVQDTGFDLIDLNLGCPAKRVVGCNGGSGCCATCPRSARSFGRCARR